MHASSIPRTSSQFHQVASYLLFSTEATPTAETPCVPIEIKLQPNPISSSSNPQIVLAPCATSMRMHVNLTVE